MIMIIFEGKIHKLDNDINTDYIIELVNFIRKHRDF